MRRRTALILLVLTAVSLGAQAPDRPIHVAYRQFTLANGLNVHAGRVTHPAVAAALGYDLLPTTRALAA